MNMKNQGDSPVTEDESASNAFTLEPVPAASTEQTKKTVRKKRVANEPSSESVAAKVFELEPNMTLNSPATGVSAPKRRVAAKKALAPIAEHEVPAVPPIPIPSPDSIPADDPPLVQDPPLPPSGEPQSPIQDPTPAIPMKTEGPFTLGPSLNKVAKPSALPPLDFKPEAIDSAASKARKKRQPMMEAIFTLGDAVELPAQQMSSERRTRPILSEAESEPLDDIVARPPENFEPDPAFQPPAVAVPVPVADASELFTQVISGKFDADDPAHGSNSAASGHESGKRVLLPELESPKLHKVLAQAGIGSRRHMEQLIMEGKVLVNDQPAHIGQRISFGDRVKLGGKLLRLQILPPAPRILAYHKPAGEVVTFDDPQQRPTVFRNLPRLQQGKWQSVGRLDINTEGLLLFTNAGYLANHLMHPRFGVEREYAVRVLGTLESEARQRLLSGVEIEGQVASFRSIENGGGEGVNHWYRVVITEGRNREVRKLFDAVGLAVSRLIRIRYGTVVLPRGLRRGVWVDLPESDVRAICRLVGAHPSALMQERQDTRRERPPMRAPSLDAAAPVARASEYDNRSERPRRGHLRQRPSNNPVRQNAPYGAPHPAEPRHERHERNVTPQHQPSAPRMQRDAYAGSNGPRKSTSSFQPRDPMFEDDIDPSRIPNPLEQTFDKRFVQRDQGLGRPPRGTLTGFGPGGSAPEAHAPRRQGQSREPDPLQTTVGYIGADAFHHRNDRKKRR
jgi:23S rRNA pseudouridine2605 synthase